MLAGFFAKEGDVIKKASILALSINTAFGNVYILETTFTPLYQRQPSSVQNSYGVN